jgi:CheY-like chemotaxis protein
MSASTPKPGHGTTVKLYLPRAPARCQAGRRRPRKPRRPVRRRHETVLVVEDDELVRQLACRELRPWATGPSTAAPTASRRAARSSPIEPGPSAIDLLFTDVVMPGGLSGRELADAATIPDALRPGLPCCTPRATPRTPIVHHGRLDAGRAMLLPKPYRRRRELARAVRVDALTLMSCGIDRQLIEVGVRERVVGNAEAVVDLAKFVAPQSPDLGAAVAPAEPAIPLVQACVEVEGGASAVTAQQRYETDIGGHPVIPTLHQLHRGHRSPVTSGASAVSGASTRPA